VIAGSGVQSEVDIPPVPEDVPPPLPVAGVPPVPVLVLDPPLPELCELPPEPPCVPPEPAFAVPPLPVELPGEPPDDDRVPPLPPLPDGLSLIAPWHPDTDRARARAAGKPKRRTILLIRPSAIQVVVSI